MKENGRFFRRFGDRLRAASAARERKRFATNGYGGEALEGVKV